VTPKQKRFFKQLLKLRNKKAGICNPRCGRAPAPWLGVGCLLVVLDVFDAGRRCQTADHQCRNPEDHLFVHGKPLLGCCVSATPCGGLGNIHPLAYLRKEKENSTFPRVGAE